MSIQQAERVSETHDHEHRRPLSVVAVITGAIVLALMAVAASVVLGSTERASQHYTVAAGGQGDALLGLSLPGRSSVSAILGKVVPGVSVTLNSTSSFVHNELFDYAHQVTRDRSGQVDQSPVLIGLSASPADPIVPPTDVTIWTASAANATLSNQALAQLKSVYSISAPNIRVHVVALADNPTRDPLGTRLVLGLAVLGLVSIGLGLFTGWRPRPRRERVKLLVAVPAVVAIVLTTVLQFLLGAMVGSWLVNVALLFLSSVAIATPIEVAGRRWGRASLAAWASVFFLTGFPYWTVSAIWQVLGSPLARVFQVFPVPAMNTAVRRANFYDFHSFWFSFCVLLVWASPAIMSLLAIGREFWVKHDHSPRFMGEPVPDLPPQRIDPTTADLGRSDT